MSNLLGSKLLEVSVCQLPHAPADLPAYATEGSAGMDLRAAITEPVTLQPLERTLIPTGLILQLPLGYEAQIRPRSGLSIKHGITLINAVGTIDSDYRHEVKIPVVNLSASAYTIEPLERVAQMVIAPVTQVQWHQVDEATIEVDRQVLVAQGGRQGGFGSTGVQ